MQIYKSFYRAFIILYRKVQYLVRKVSSFILLYSVQLANETSNTLFIFLPFRDFHLPFFLLIYLLSFYLLLTNCFSFLFWLYTPFQQSIWQSFWLSAAYHVTAAYVLVTITVAIFIIVVQTLPYLSNYSKGSSTFFLFSHLMLHALPTTIERIIQICLVKQQVLIIVWQKKYGNLEYICWFTNSNANTMPKMYFTNQIFLSIFTHFYFINLVFIVFSIHFSFNFSSFVVALNFLVILYFLLDILYIFNKFSLTIRSLIMRSTI